MKKLPNRKQRKLLKKQRLKQKQLRKRLIKREGLKSFIEVLNKNGEFICEVSHIEYTITPSTMIRGSITTSGSVNLKHENIYYIHIHAKNQKGDLYQLLAENVVFDSEQPGISKYLWHATQVSPLASGTDVASVIKGKKHLDEMDSREKFSLHNTKEEAKAWDIPG